MRKSLICLLFWVGWLLSFPLLKAQAIKAEEVPFLKSEIPIYQFASLGQEVILEMAYAESLIKNPEKWLELTPTHEPYAIDLVFTRYPKNFADWRTHYSQLLRDRLNALFALDSAFQDLSLRWHMYLQTDCNSEAQAKRFFHGFVVHYRPKKVRTLTDVGSVEELQGLLQGDFVSQDSTVCKIMNRHPEWRDMLVIVDWTASMYQYGAQVVLWQKEHMNHPHNRARHFVFFNDGNGKKSWQKEVGKTGGIYCTESTNLQTVAKTMEKVMLRGNGGDIAENDLEVLIKAVNLLKGYQDVVLIADNRSDIRDIQLLPQIDRPIHIILCGVGTDNYINTDYVKLAFESGGSIHTLETELNDLQKLEPGERIAIGNMHYELKGGKISQVARAR